MLPWHTLIKHWLPCMQEDRLRRRLNKLKMDMNVVRGDGNCLVRALVPL